MGIKTSIEEFIAKRAASKAARAAALDAASSAAPKNAESVLGNARQVIRGSGGVTAQILNFLLDSYKSAGPKTKAAIIGVAAFYAYDFAGNIIPTSQPIKQRQEAAAALSNAGLISNLQYQGDWWKAYLGFNPVHKPDPGSRAEQLYKLHPELVPGDYDAPGEIVRKANALLDIVNAPTEAAASLAKLQSQVAAQAENSLRQKLYNYTRELKFTQDDPSHPGYAYRPTSEELFNARPDLLPYITEEAKTKILKGIQIGASPADQDIATQTLNRYLEGDYQRTNIVGLARQTAGAEAEASIGVRGPADMIELRRQLSFSRDAVSAMQVQLNNNGYDKSSSIQIQTIDFITAMQMESGLSIAQNWAAHTDQSKPGYLSIQGNESLASVLNAPRNTLPSGSKKIVPFVYAESSPFAGKAAWTTDPQGNIVVPVKIESGGKTTYGFISAADYDSLGGPVRAPKYEAKPDAAPAAAASAGGATGTPGQGGGNGGGGGGAAADARPPGGDGTQLAAYAPPTGGAPTGGAPRPLVAAPPAAAQFASTSGSFSIANFLFGGPAQAGTLYPNQLKPSEAGISAPSNSNGSADAMFGLSLAGLTAAGAMAMRRRGGSAPKGKPVTLNREELEGGEKIAETVLKEVGEASKFMKVAKFVGRKVPIVGAFIAAGVALTEVGGFLGKGQYAHAGVATVNGIIDTFGGLGGIFTGFMTDAAHEAIRSTAISVGGKSFGALSKSGTRDIVEMTADGVGSLVASRPGIRPSARGAALYA